MRIILLAILLTVLSGCVVSTVAKTAIDVVTLPVKVVSRSVDLATTSQSEADEKRGRKLRKAEETAGRDAREAEKRRKVEQDEDAPAPQPE